MGATSKRLVLVLFAAATAATTAHGQSRAPATIVAGQGNVMFSTPSHNQITGLTTKIVAPPKHASVGTLFLWPGLQPGGDNFLPIDNGVLQPVLTWGLSCAPGNQPVAYSAWWISAQYVNTFGKHPGYTDCLGGPIMIVDSGDTLLVNMSLSGSVWTQTITNLKQGGIVGFQIDMQRQAQNYAYFFIEPYGASPISNVTFLETIITFANKDPLNCHLEKRGVGDFASTPVMTPDALRCSIEKITLQSVIDPTVPDASCRKEGAIKSIDGHHPTAITFRNNRGSAIRLYWINYAGDRQIFSIIESGDVHTQPTYLTNPWVVTDVMDTCISLHLPSEQPSEVVVR